MHQAAFWHHSRYTNSAAYAIIYHRRIIMAKTLQNDCYVYIWYDDESIRYVGKGREQRAFRHPFFKVQIVASNLTQEESCGFERLLISKIGRKDKVLGPLINTTDGGDGGDTLSGKKLYYDPNNLDRDGYFFNSGNEPHGWVKGRHPNRKNNHIKTVEQAEKSAAKQRGQKRNSSNMKKGWANRVKELTHKVIGCIACKNLISIQNFERHLKGSRCISNQ